MRSWWHQVAAFKTVGTHSPLPCEPIPWGSALHFPAMKIFLRPFLLVATSAALFCAPLHAEPPKIVESPTSATAGKATIALTDSNKTQTIEAGGKDVAIEGDHNKITLSGACHALTINGNDNMVTAEALGTVSTPGNRNKVTWTKAVDGEKPQVTDLGKDNSLGKRAD